MKFDSWMKNTGLSKSSVLKYYGAIVGVLSDWARESGIISGSIIDVTSSVKFDFIALKIRELSIFQERNSTGHNMYSSALNKYSEFIAKGVLTSVEEDIEAIVTNPAIDTTEKTQLINSRLGQGQYRKSLTDYWKCCSVTGYSDTRMLVASHIKPWSHSSNSERLDIFNGLLLVPNLDKTFDRGLISFEGNGKILISTSLQQPNALGINDRMSVPLVKDHQAYMKYHRTNLFIST